VSGPAAAALAAAVFAAGLHAAAAAPPPRIAAGTPLQEALQILAEQGLPLIYSTSLVTPDLRVVAAPRGAAPREVLDEILAPHGLEARPSPTGQLVIVRRPGAAAPPRPEARAREDEPEPAPAAVVRETIEVTPSRFSLLGGETGGGRLLGRDEVSRLPHLADDVYRALAFLPGMAGGDISARLEVRGGAADETLVLIDGQEVYQAFHFEDFQGIFSIVDAEAVGGVELFTGGFPARYGNRLSGVIDIATATPEPGRRTSAGVSFLHTRALSEGTFAGDRGQWLVSARRGYLDFVLGQVRSANDDFTLTPAYSDLLSRVQYRWSDRTTVAADVLAAYDRLRFASHGSDLEQAHAHFGSGIAWLTADTGWTPRLSSRSRISLGRVESERRVASDDLHGRAGCGDCSLRSAQVLDRRSFGVAALAQEWDLRAGARHELALGLEARALAGSYDYASRSAVLDPLETGEPFPVVTVRAERLDPSGWQYAAFLTDRIRLSSAVAAEAGLRWDRQTWAGGRQVSPRLDLVYRPGERSAWRAAWGRYYQSQGLNELQIEDGVTAFSAAELAEHRLVAWEGSPSPRLHLRAEAYQKLMRHLRPRYENLFEPIDLAPEAAADRVRIAPERAEARGVEVLFDWQGGPRWSCWGSYTRASVEDEIGGAWIPRSWDQRHAARLGGDVRLGPHWSLGLAGIYHSGWPVTTVSARAVRQSDGSLVIVPELGRRNGERYPSYQRVDARVSREVSLGRGTFTFFLEVTNLLNHGNVRAISDFDFIVEGGAVEVVPRYERWLPRIPSFGLDWSF
jgi:outer membrane cobalamin receptor